MLNYSIPESCVVRTTASMRPHRKILCILRSICLVDREFVSSPGAMHLLFKQVISLLCSILQHVCGAVVIVNNKRCS